MPAIRIVFLSRPNPQSATTQRDGQDDDSDNPDSRRAPRRRKSVAASSPSVQDSPHSAPV